MKKFTESWNRSKKPSKQRKYRFRAPLHRKQNLMQVHLSPTLRKKYNQRSIGLRKGDKVKIMRGERKKHEGKVDRIQLKKNKITLEGVEITKKDGSKTPLTFEPSNMMITEIVTEDKMRQKTLERKKHDKVTP